MTIRAPGNGGAMKMNMSPDGMMHLEAERLTLQQLADSLGGFVGRPVIDPALESLVPFSPCS